MSGYGPGSATGGMASGGGQTTQVGLSGRLSPKDRATLCDALCKCKAVGVATKSGRILRQNCVQQRLDAQNDLSKATTGVPTVYRPEQSYDMSQNPPAPIMDDSDPLAPVSSLRDWIKNVWPGGFSTYKGGEGNVRRPDVVVVNDPTQPPVQSNIKSVVEMKFPGDDYSPDQRDDYVEIAGSPAKFVHLGPAECGCGDEQKNEQTAPATQSAPQSDLDDIFGGSSKLGRSALPAMPFPLPPIPAFP
ncbi:VRR-NUC domain-containing protein [Paraburkholderia bryophila]|uniref:VRR-NUC domain-containing protein n=1 Tax=Paraburkholderia bryophila TaxID=420952 RepID=UPI00234AB320|nr:VRR-NUC domain-containing protein [Paraburkholderia bryophila]WCM24554.1 VRR-NUC domain-containing protein [Paraburkholderia bryophila]